MTDHARPNWTPGQPDDQPAESPIAESDLKTIAARNPEQIFVICAMSRPGFSSFMIELEYTNYEPDTERNKLFELFLVDFPLVDPMTWAVIAFPKSDLDKALETAKKYNFKLSQDTVPACITNNPPEFFPMYSGPNVYSIEGFIVDQAKVAEIDAHWQGVIKAHREKIEKGHS